MSKKALKTLSLVGFGLVMMIPFLAFGQEADAKTLEKIANFDSDKWIGLAAGIGMALASFGGALGQSRAAAAALDGIARNPNAADKISTPMLLGLALIESLVLFSFVISFMLIGNLG
jgi:F-type H+-transporting ATPase subunit c